jgi:hypothetical protein
MGSVESIIVDFDNLVLEYTPTIEWYDRFTELINKNQSGLTGMNADFHKTVATHVESLWERPDMISMGMAKIITTLYTNNYSVSNINVNKFSLLDDESIMFVRNFVQNMEDIMPDSLIDLHIACEEKREHIRQALGLPPTKFNQP